MRARLGVPFLLLATVLGPVASTARPSSAPAPAGGPRPPAEVKEPLAFEANRGQTDSRVRFLARGPGYRLFLTPTETVLNAGGTAVRLTAAGADPEAVVEGLSRTPATATYVRAGSRTTAPMFEKVAVRGLYPGIDAVYYGNPHQLEYDYVVAPGADPGVIALQVAGADRVSLDDGGNLHLATPTGTLTQQRPVAYQEVGGARQRVDAGYVVEGSTVRLQLGAYDPARPLVIDPVITYSTYLGGSTGGLADEEGDVITVDPAGNVYVTGHTGSTDFPTLGGLVDTTLGGTDDAFVSKFDPAGNLLWSTYFGGAGFEQGFGIAYDPMTNTVVVTGTTTSDQTTFPLITPFDATLGGIQDAFVARFDANTGALLYSTYLGGSDVDVGFAVAVDSAGNPVVTGQTFSPDYPLAGAVFDAVFSPPSEAFVTKLTAAGNALFFSTFLGGTGDEAGYGIAVDGSDRAYVTGFTTSPDLPLFNPIQGPAGAEDVLLAAFGPVGNPLYSTYFGGAGSDTGYGIDTDFGGTAYVTGQTSSAGLPAPGGFDPTLTGPTDAFVAVFAPPPVPSLLAFTYLGGSGDEAGFSIALDPASRPYVTGFTSSGDFPLLAPVDATFGGAEEAFVTRFNNVPLTLAYSTFLGGSGDEEAFGIAVSGTNAHVTGFTDSPDFPLVNPFDPTLGGTSDAFVTKLALETTPPTCALTAVITGPPKQIQVTVQDTGSGLASIMVTSATNATVFVPVFPIGTTNPVVVTATKVDQNAGSQFVLQITDVDGNVTTCDPIDTPVVRDAGQPVTQTFSGVPQAEHKVQIVNGTPGVTTIELTVNGKRFGPFQLADGEERNFSIASAMKPGADNVISVTARGKPGGSAALLVHD